MRVFVTGATGFIGSLVVKDGVVLDVALTLSPIRDSAGAIIGASKIVEDLTAKLLADHQMRRLEADRGYLADIVESSNDAIIARSIDGLVVSWNKAATVRNAKRY